MNRTASSLGSVQAEHSPWRRRLAAAGWVVMALLSIQTAVVGLRFLVLGPDVLYPPQDGEAFADPSGISRHFLFLLEERWLRFAGHFIGGPLALLVGPFQLLNGLRRRRPRLHRTLGWVYAGSVLVGGGAGLVLAFGSYGGLTTHFGFGMLAVLWLAFTATAVWSARRGRYRVHRRFMIRSFALTFGAVTLRAYIPLLLVAGVPFPEIYQTVAWLAWVPNLVVAEMFLAGGGGVAVAAAGTRS